jgi:hypothetical protein
MVSPLYIPIIFVCSIPIVAIGYPLARALASRMERKPVGGGIPVDVAARLERMEQSIDSIAIEIERISEGQRFTTKLLAERAAVPPAPYRPGAPDIR